MKKIYLFVFLQLIACSLIIAQKPVLLKDINPSGNSFPGSFAISHDGKLIFSAMDQVNGGEPWYSDGTDTGTYMIKNINPAGSSSIFNISSTNSYTFFMANDGTHGIELWKTDGTDQGTSLVSDINTGSGGQVVPFTFYEFKSKADRLYFPARNASLEVELYSTDGTGVIKHDIYPGGTSSNPENFTHFDDKVIFKATASGSVNKELYYISDTTVGLYSDVDPTSFIGGMMYSNFSNGVYQGNLFFAGYVNGNFGNELCFTTGGPPPVTVNILADINPGPGFSDPDHFYRFKNNLYFTARDASGQRKIWVYSASDGLQQFGDFTVSNLDNPNFTSDGYGRYMYFKKPAASGGFELWLTDGTVEGTRIVAGPNTTPAFNQFSQLTMHELDHRLYFVSTPLGTSNINLFRTEGNADDIELVAPDYTNTDNHFVGELFYDYIRQRIYFSAVFDTLIGREPYYVESPSTISWTGNVSDNWNNANNWSPKVVPSPNDNVYISIGNPHFPNIKNLQNAYCKNLIMGNFFNPVLKMTGGNLHIHGIVEAEHKSSFDFQGGTLKLYHGSSWPEDMVFNNVEIKNQQTVSSKAKFHFNGYTFFEGNFIASDFSSNSTITEIILQEGIQNSLVFKGNVTLNSRTGIGFNFFPFILNETVATVPEIVLNGTSSQKITVNNVSYNTDEGIKGRINCTVVLFNELVSFTKPTSVMNLVLEKDFDLAGQTLVIEGKLNYNSVSLPKILNSKANKGKLYFNPVYELSIDTLEQFINANQLQLIKFDTTYSPQTAKEIVLASNLRLDSLIVQGCVDMNGYNLTVGKASTNKGYVEAEAIKNDLNTGTLTLLGNSATPTYNVGLTEIFNLTINSPQGAKLTNTDYDDNGPYTTYKSWSNLKGKIQLKSGNLDLNGSVIKINTDTTIRPFPGKLFESNGFSLTNSNPSPLFLRSMIFYESYEDQPLTNRDFGGLGMIISTPHPLNNFYIERSILTTDVNGNNSINRVYFYKNSDNPNPDEEIFIGFKYDEDELNGLDENDLQIYRKEQNPGINTWEPIPSSVDPINNIVSSTVALNSGDISPDTLFGTIYTLAESFSAVNPNLNFNKSASIKINSFPNPFDDSFTLIIHNEIEGQVTTSVHDLSGRVVLNHSEMMKPGMNTIHYNNLENLSPGIYFLRLQTPLEKDVIKIIKR